MIDFSISILSLENLDGVKKTLDTLLKQEYDLDFELILTDNASKDKTIDYFMMLNSNFKNIHILRHKENLGFIGGNEKALHVAKGRYFLMFNDDALAEEGWLRKIYNAFQEDIDIKIVGAMTRCLGPNGNGYTYGDEYVEGSCLAINARFARNIGLFSDDLSVAYCEDSDLSLRVRAMGYKIKHVDVGFSHIGAVTASKNLIDVAGYSIKNHYHLVKRWGSYLKTKSFSENITIIREGAKGDVFLITPIIEHLKKENIHRQINVKTKCHHLLQGNPHIGSLVTDLMPGDRIINLDNAYETRPNSSIVDAYAKVAGIKNLKNKIPRVYFNSNGVSQHIKEFCDNNKYIVFHADSSWPGRTIKPDIFLQVVYKAKMDDYKTVQIGTQEQRITCDEVFLSEGIQDVAYIIKKCNGFIGIDSMPFHIAQSYGKPGAVPFGCINPDYRVFVPEIMRPVTNPNVGCKFCHHWRSAPRIFSDCLRNHPMCVDVITADEIYNEFKKGLEVYMATLETSKIRSMVLKFCKGNGIDIGCRDDKIKTIDCIGFDKYVFDGVDVVGDASKKLDFENNYFDYVYSSHCLEDIEDTETTLKEWLRILKVGGNIILQIPHKDYYKGYNADHCHEFVTQDIIILLKNFNCEILFNHNDVGENRYSFVIVAKKLTDI